MSVFDVEIIPGEYAILKIEFDSDPPNFIFNSKFFTILKSVTEFSVICEATVIPPNFVSNKIDRSWSLMKLVGPFGFDQTGVLANFLRPLANAEIGILALSSFDTDYILVKSKNLINAKASLEKMNYRFTKS